MKKFLLSLLIGVIVFGFTQTTAADPKKEKEPVDKITFIHYKDGKVKIEGKTPPAKGYPCYKLLGIKWKTSPIDFYIGSEIDQNAIVSATTEWDKYTSKILFRTYTVTTTDFDDIPDGKNEYSLGYYPQKDVIAVTNIWYTRYTKAIVEYDVLFNNSYNWGNAGEDLNVMDWQNIATHETGHGLGLGDVYQSTCSEVTMYGYSNYGEIIKRDLATPDITALQLLYGK